MNVIFLKDKALHAQYKEELKAAIAKFERIGILHDLNDYLDEQVRSKYPKMFSFK